MSVAVLIEPNPTESLEPISFRGSTDDRTIMADLAERLNVKPSAAVRIALRVLRDLTMLPRLQEVGYRVHLHAVLPGALSDEGVIRDPEEAAGVIRDHQNVIRSGRP